MTTFAYAPEVEELRRQRAEMFRRLEGSNLGAIFGSTLPGQYWLANNAYGADVHTGAMVALLPSEADATRLAVPGGEPAEQLHVTLMYLGKADQIPELMQDALEHALRTALSDDLAPYHFDTPLTADGFAVSVFNPERADKQPCIVLGLSGDGLAQAQDFAAMVVGQIRSVLGGFDIPEQHRPWTPHLTLIYTGDASKVEDLLDRTGPITFDRIRVAFAGKVCDIPLRPGAVLKSLPGMDAYPVGSLVRRMCFSGRRLDALLLGKYNPNQPRDDDGQWSDGIPGSTAKLKGAGQIDLLPGERLLGSERVRSDGGRAWLAVTEKDGKRSLRIGLGNATFGTRHDSGGPWRAGPDRTTEINEERAEQRGLIDELENEIEDIEDDPDTDPAYLAGLRKQLEEYEDAGAGSDVDELPGGYTALLDENGARQLRETLAKALDDGDKLQDELDAPYQELDALTLQRDKLKHKVFGRKFTDEESAEWNRLTTEIARAEAEVDPNAGPERPESGYWTLAEGSISGQWADVHYDIYLDDPSVGVEVKLGAVPHESDMDFDDLRGAEMTASLAMSEADELVKLLTKLESGPRVRNYANRLLGKYNPNQPRDDEGQWTDGVPGTANGLDKLKLAKRAPAGIIVRSSKKIKTDYADVGIAEVDGPDGPQVRIGLMNRESGKWDAGLTGDARKSELRRELADKQALFDSDEDASVDIEDQIGELETELEELDNERTAVLTPELMTNFRHQLGDALEAARANKARVDADTKAQEGIDEQRDTLIAEHSDPALERKIREASWSLRSKLQTIKRMETGPNPSHWTPEDVAELLEDHRADVPGLEATLAPMLARRAELMPPDARARLEDLDRQWQALNERDITDLITTAEVSAPNGARVLAEIWGSDDVDDQWTTTRLLVLTPGETTSDVTDVGDDYGYFPGLKGLTKLIAALESARPSEGIQNRAPRLRNEFSEAKVRRDRKGRFAKKNAAAIMSDLDDAMDKLRALSKFMSEDERSDLDDALDALKNVRKSRQQTADAGGPDYVEIESEQYQALAVGVTDGAEIEVLLEYDDGGIYLTPQEAEEVAEAIDDFNSMERSPYDVTRDEPIAVAERTTASGAIKVVLWDGGVIEVGPSDSESFGEDETDNLMLDPTLPETDLVADALEELAETAAKRAQAAGVQNRAPRLRAKYNPDQPRDPGGENGGQWVKTPGPDLPDGALQGIEILSQERYAETYGDAVAEEVISRDDGSSLTVRYFESSDAHVAIDFPDGRTQVLEDMTPEAMRQLAYDLEDVMNADFEDGAADDEGLVADADSREHSFYVGLYETTDVRVQPTDDSGELGDYLDLSDEDAHAFVEALRDVADGYDEYFGDGVEIEYLTPGGGPDE